MRHLDLFSGIGGFALAAQWAGYETVAFCEVNDWCYENALKRNWPGIPNLKDVTKLCLKTKEEGLNYDAKYFNDTYGGIDLITAGVPCQPASIIGKRKGVEDSRWLWPDTLRIIKELQPTWVVCENPTGLLSLNGGEQFGEILEGFRQAGYECWWETIAASAVGGGHRRERVWLVAYLGSAGLEGHAGDGDALCRQEREEAGKVGPTPPEVVFPLRNSERWWEDQSPVPIVVDGVSAPAFWKEAVIATGNAIVPQVAYQIIKGFTNGLNT